jgi:cobaltochelatase CobN
LAGLAGLARLACLTGLVGWVFLGTAGAAAAPAEATPPTEATTAPAEAMSVALLTTDSDSFMIHRAVEEVPWPAGLEVGAYCLRDLLDNPAKAERFDRSRLILVDVMDDNLSDYVRERGLLSRSRVLALRGSKDDQALAAEGFEFREEIAAYYAHLKPLNVQNMIRRALALELGPDAAPAYGPPESDPEEALYHPLAEGLFTTAEDYLAWSAARLGPAAGRPYVGLTFFSTNLMPGQKEALDQLIFKLEEAGLNVLPAYGHDGTLIERFFLDPEGRARIEALLSFGLKFYIAYDERIKESLIRLDVPVFNAIKLYTQTIEEWVQSQQGLAASDVVWNLDNAEVSGAVEPIVLIGKVEERLPDGALVYHDELIEDRVDDVVARLKAWIGLRAKPNGEKKVAILIYNNSRGKQNIGASYLNVFRSLEAILASLREAGYGLPAELVLDEAAVKDLVLKGGRNVGSWAPGELDALLASGLVEELDVEVYQKWFAELPEEFRRKVVEQWGPPGSPGPMIKDGRLVIPAIRLGNLAVMPEPARGEVDDPLKLYHDPVLQPHHQYIAAYLWLKRGFGADAMVHLGTHATHEWLPGKQSGLSSSCPPELLGTDLPNVYPYIVDDVGEGLQAKRRGRAVVVDHLIPPLTPAGNHKDHRELAAKLATYEQARKTDAPTAPRHLAEIKALAAKLGLDGGLGGETPAGPAEAADGAADGTAAEAADGLTDGTAAGLTDGAIQDAATLDEDAGLRALSEKLEYLQTALTPYGLHVFGRSPQDDALDDLAQAVAEGGAGEDDRAPRAIRAALAASGQAEMEALLAGLAGRYVAPGEGNDPVRNPASIPTGRDFFGLSPSLMPTRAAWELAQDAAEQIIAKHQAEKGRFPDKVAVILWAVESLRNEGLNEATILRLIGVEPIWSPNGRVIGVKPTPAARLGRPRVDVVVDASGLYRDLFPDKILLLDKAFRQAAAQDDLDNFVRRGDELNRQALLAQGMTEEEAGRFSRARIFSEAPGAYGNRVSELVSASGLWEDRSAISDVFRTHTGFAYGEDYWGAPAKEALDVNLAEVKTAWHSVSSNLYALMDNDDMYMFLGGLSAAVEALSGEAPQTLLADHRDLGRVSMTPLAEFLRQEAITRYLNPKWIEGMKAQGYAGATEMSHYVEYLWGWQVTAPESVDQELWDQTYEVYVEDKLGQGLAEFLDAENPWAFQSMSGRLLESVRKGFWTPSEEVQRRLARDYALSVVMRGLACCDHTCNNPMLHQMVMNIVSLPGVMSPELAAEFRMAVERAGQASLEEMVGQRAELLRDLGQSSPARPTAGGGPEAASEAQSVRGFKMEKVQTADEETMLPSSGVEWTASIFVLAVVALLLVGLRRRRREGGG